MPTVEQASVLCKHKWVVVREPVFKMSCMLCGEVFNSTDTDHKISLTEAWEKTLSEGTITALRKYL